MHQMAALSERYNMSHYIGYWKETFYWAVYTIIERSAIAKDDAHALETIAFVV